MKGRQQGETLLDPAASELALAHRALLLRALALEGEKRTQHPERPPSWEWFEVKADPGLLKRLVIAGLLRVEWRSNSGTHYRVEDPEGVRRLLESEPEPIEEGTSGPPALPPDLFDLVVGHDPLKSLLLRALSAERPVHLLMVGPPATAKTLFLMDLDRLPGAWYALGGTSRRQGLVRLLADRRPRLLLVDELDKMDREDFSALLSVMETGRLSETKTGRYVQSDLPLRVFAAANTERGLPPELLSRFLRVRLRPYAPGELREVMERVLVRRESAPEAEARAVAEACLRNGLRDVRDAVRLWRLAQGPAETEDLARQMAGSTRA